MTQIDKTKHLKGTNFNVYSQYIFLPVLVMKVLQLQQGQQDEEFVSGLLDRRRSWMDNIPQDILHFKCKTCKTSIQPFNPNGVIIINTLKDQLQATLDQLICDTKEAHRDTTECASADFVISPNFGPPGCLVVVGQKSPSTFLHHPIQISEYTFSPEILVQSSEAVDESIVAVFKREAA